MIDKNKVQYYLNEILGETDLYLVDLVVKPSNKIVIELDSEKGISIDQCAQVSTALEGKLDRNLEDFDLEVSSPGLGQSFKVLQQYRKNVGKQVSVLMKTGSKYTGKLVEVADHAIKVEATEKVRVEGKKKPEQVTTIKELNYSDIKAAKAVINF